MTDREELLKVLDCAKEITQFCKKSDCFDCPFKKYLQHTEYAITVTCGLTEFGKKPRTWKVEELEENEE